MQLSITNKDILKLAAPISVSLLIPQISFLTDTIFLGQLGERELGVNGMAGIFYLILSMIGYGLANGIQVQMSRRAGERNYTGLARTFTNGMMLCLMFGIGLMVVSFILSPIIFNTNLHDDSNAHLTLQFLNMRTWGLPFLLLTQLANSFYIATNQSRYLVHGAIASTAVNIVLDYGLIFGKLGLPEMGLAGAALASAIAEVVFCAVMYGIFYYKKMQHKFPVLSTGRFDTALARRSLVIASPLIVQFLFSIGGWQIFFIYVEHLGTRELAVSQILRSVFGVAGIGLWALASSCNTIVSNVIGQSKQRLVIPVILRTIKLAVIYAVALGAILVIFPDSFLGMYRNDPDLVQFAIPSLRVVAISSIIMAVATVLFNGVMGTGNTRINLLIEVICVGTYVVYCYFVIERMRLPLYWAWASEFVYWGALVTACILYLRTGRWRNKTV
ncbi:MAG: MATE family efflux transporter [Chitinophagales bacterium]|nr:MATE family efflux transporter [Chitinophagales bacterium]